MMTAGAGNAVLPVPGTPLHKAWAVFACRVASWRRGHVPLHCAASTYHAAHALPAIHNSLTPAAVRIAAVSLRSV